MKNLWYKIKALLGLSLRDKTASLLFKATTKTMIAIKRIYFLLLFTLVVSNLYAQTDSVGLMKKAIAAEKVDSVKATLLHRLITHYRYIKKDSAIYYCQELIDLAVITKNKKTELRAIEIMARLRYDTQNLSEALRLSYVTLEKAVELKDTAREFFSIRQIMWIYGQVLNYNKQMEYALRLKELALTPAIKNSIMATLAFTSALNGIGNAYKGLGKYDSALVYFRESFALSDKINGRHTVVSRYMGDFFEQYNQPDSAFYYYRYALKDADELSDIKSALFYKLGKIYYEKQQLDSAFTYAKNSLTLATSLPDSSGMELANFLLSDIYKTLGKQDSAYYFMATALSLQKLLNAKEDINKTGNILFAETLHKQELELQRKQDEQKYRSNLRMYALIAAVFVFLLLSVLLYRNNKQKQKSSERIKASYDRLRATQAQLIQSEKMASLGELTAGIAHEIQNPLNFVNNFSEVNKELLAELQQEIDKGNVEEVKALAKDISENEDKINHHGKRADSIVKGMLQHSRSGSGQKEPTNINALCDEYLRLSYHGLRAKNKSFNATLQTDFDETIGNINIVTQDIGRVVMNLLTNAFYAVGEKIKTANEDYNPTVSIKTKKLAKAIEITVQDNGNGIPDAVIEKIFQPFFTTKPTGSGTGLGLSLSYDIVKAHGGELKVDSKEGEFTRFVITLPV